MKLKGSYLVKNHSCNLGLKYFHDQIISQMETCFCISFERTNAKIPTVPIFSELSRNQGPCHEVPKGRTLPKFSNVLSILEKTHHTFDHLELI